MSNYSFGVRAKRWIRFSFNYIKERIRGLDFSMVYVGEIQKNVAEFHGYSMTDEKDMKRMLKAIPVDPKNTAFMDVGCGKGICMKCAVESGYGKVAGLDLDQHLLDIAKKNMSILKMDVKLINANAVEYDGYADYDVFYFYNPFGRSIFEQVIEKIKESQQTRNREIWIAYYHPVFSELFDKAGFELKNEVKDKSRDTTTKFYYLPACK